MSLMLVHNLQSFIDLWAIPVQILVAFTLLYYQVNIAFLAGITAIILMIPVNSAVARRIGSATGALMHQKDRRINILGEALKGILGLKYG